MIDKSQVDKFELSPCEKLLTYTLAAAAATGIRREEAKVTKSIKEAAKKGQMDVAKILAKELIQSRKAVSKMYASKAQMNSVIMSMQQQLCTLHHWTVQFVCSVLID